MRELAASVVGALLLFGCSAAEEPAPAPTTAVPPASTASSAAPSPTTSDTTTVLPTTLTTATPSTTGATTTDPPQPPLLLVADPSAGQIITTRVHRFRGTTDPGAVVAVGNNYADVNDEGQWNLDLTLPPGSSATTVIATDTTRQLSTSVRLQLRCEPDTELRRGGIDHAGCGTPYEEAMQALTDLLGEPSQLLPQSQSGTAVQAEWSWSGGGFVATFDEWSLCVMGEPGEYLHLMGWEIHGDSAGLSYDSIAPGSTVEEFMVQVEGDVHLDKEPREGGYRFFLSDGMLPPPVFGYANGSDPVTAVILVLASEAPR